MTRAYNTATTQQNSGGAVAGVTAGKNVLINGGFDIWQRGTSFASSASAYIYTSDRWLFVGGSFATGRTLSRQASGLTGFNYCARMQRDSGNTSTQPLYLHHTLETADSLRLAGQTITLSFYARVGANYSGSNSLSFIIASGTGTDQRVDQFTGNSNIYSNTFTTLSTTWQRFTAIVTVPSTSTELGFYFFYTPSGTAGAADHVETTGFQIEAGSVATPFSRAGGTIQGELAACQRYFYQHVSGAAKYICMAAAYSSSISNGYLQYPVTMRTTPTMAITAGTNYYLMYRNGTYQYFNTLAQDYASSSPTGATGTGLYITGLSQTAGWAGWFQSENAAASIAFSAEL